MAERNDVDTEIKDFKWETGPDGITVTKYTGDGTAAAVPAAIEGIGVTGIGSFAFAGCGMLAHVTLPEGLTSIGGYAFEDCGALEDIVIPNGVKIIEGGAFSHCRALRSVTLPSGLEQIWSGAFVGCEALERFRLDEDNPAFSAMDGVLYSGDRSTLLLWPNGKAAVFEIPQHTAHIGREAFRCCKSLCSIVIPGSVTDIGPDAFKRCDNLISVEIRDGVTKIGAYAFSSCGSLEKIFLPASLTQIEERAFDDCTSLSDIWFGGTKRQWKRICAQKWNGDEEGIRVHFRADRAESEQQPTGRAPRSEAKRKTLILHKPHTEHMGDDKVPDIRNDGSFRGAKLAASCSIDWGDALPRAHSVLTVKAAYPFACRIGNRFSAIFRTASLEESYIVTARLLDVLSDEGDRALIRAEILCVRDMLSFLKRLTPRKLKRMKAKGSYKYDWPSGNRAAPDIRREREGWTYLHNTWGGDFDYDHYIKTDEDGVDHLVITECLSYLRAEIFCGDRVLGMHRDFPFRWENGLLLNRESAVVADCSDDAADVEIPDWVQSIAWYVFMDKPKLTSISVPTGVTQFWNAFGGCSGVKTVRLIGNPGENPELEEALRQNCPQAEIIYRQRDPQENPSAVTQPRKG